MLAQYAIFVVVLCLFGDTTRVDVRKHVVVPVPGATAVRLRVACRVHRSELSRLGVTILYDNDGGWSLSPRSVGKRFACPVGHCRTQVT
jgi:hypothetical protein